LGSTIKEYSEYLQCYQLYITELSARRCEWKAEVKADERLRKEAATAGKQVVKVWTTTDVSQDMASADGTRVVVAVKSPAVSKVQVPGPPRVAAKPLSPDEKAKRSAKKRQRYRNNRRLRRLKEEATTTKWAASIARNKAAAIKAKAVIHKKGAKPKKQAPKPATKPASSKPAAKKPPAPKPIAAFTKKEALAAGYIPVPRMGYWESDGKGHMEPMD